MKRYADTVFRYWFLLLVPILVLPIGEFLMVRRTAPQISVYANLYVAQPVSDGSYQFTTPAGSLVSNMNEWLQSATFDHKVALTSPLYAKRLAHTLDPQTAAFNDLSKNVQATALGDHLVSLSYKALDAQLGLQVMEGLLNTSNATRLKVSQWQQTIVSDYYGTKLRSAQLQEQQSAKDLAGYIAGHGIKPTDYALQLDSDPTFATLFNRNKSDQETVNSLEQQVLGNPNGASSLATVVAAKQAYFVADQPSVLVTVGSKKKELTYIGLALALGILVGAAITVLLTATDSTMRYPDEVQELLGLPVVAIVAHSTVLRQRDQTVERKALRGRPIAQLEQTG